MRLDSIHPGATLDEARATIGWDLRVAPSVETTPQPTADELALIRGELDPGGAYTK
jgi:glutaconate CoA-transferase, subunit B